MDDRTGDTVLVRVNDHTWTKQAWKDYSELRVACYKLMGRKKGRQEEEEGKLERVRKSSLQACLPYFIQNSIIADASADYQRAHGSYTEADRAKVAAWLEKQYVSSNPQKIPSLEILKGKMKKAGALKPLEEQLAYEQEAELYMSVANSNKYVIEEFVISNVYRRLIVNNYVASQTNRTILATASNVVARVKAGEDFMALADTYSMDPEKTAGGVLGVCTAHDYAGEEDVWNAVRDLHDGETTGLIDAGDSWQIYKVLARDESNPKELSLKLARIFFRRALEIERPSREEVIKELENDRRQRLIQETMAERLPKAKVEFPYGRAMFGNMENMQGMFDIIEGKTNVLNTVANKTTNRVEQVEGGKRQ